MRKRPQKKHEILKVAVFSHYNAFAEISMFRTQCSEPLLSENVSGPITGPAPGRGPVQSR